MRIERYQTSHQLNWDALVRESPRSTFLFMRDYMDYHHDRFVDHSLLFYDDSNQILAVLPANQAGNELHSHGGLTYGGLVPARRLGAQATLDVFVTLKTYLEAQGISKFLYKQVPTIYHQRPADEDVYALFRLGAQLSRRDISFAVKPSSPVKVQTRRQRGVQKATAASLECRVSNEWTTYWHILSWNLETVHKTKPVHSLSEIQDLASKFPDRIKLFGCFAGTTMRAGVVIYESDQVAHAQYIASSDEGRSFGALDLLFTWLIQKEYVNKCYFDFGVSTEKEGQVLNSGLAEFKEGFGASGVACDFYKWDLSR